VTISSAPRAQAERYGALLLHGGACAVARTGRGFSATIEASGREDREASARFVLPATGIRDRRPGQIRSRSRWGRRRSPPDMHRRLLDEGVRPEAADAPERR
jgi:thioredoxin reductase